MRSGGSDRLIRWIAAVLFAAILFLRHPAALLHAELWAEDGWFWYPDAYNAGWHSLFWPHTGYLQSVARLVGLFAQPFPLSWVPTLFAAAAFVLQVLPAVFLVSRRMETALPSMPARLFLGLIYVAMPNSVEEFVNLTNAQWHLAVLAFLITIGRPAKSWLGVASDGAILLLSGLSGPFCVFLLPVAAWQFLRNRGKQHAARAVIIAVTCVVQGALLYWTMATERSPVPLGGDVIILARIVALQVLLGPLLGSDLVTRFDNSRLWHNDAVPLALALGGLLLLAIALARGQTPLRQAAVFAALAFTAALLHPQVSLTEPQWLVMTRPGAGQRYYLLPMLAWLCALVALAGDSNRVLRWIGAALLACLIVSVVGDWSYPAMARTDFAAKARAFARAPPGTRMEFDLHPAGATPMTLIKHAP